MLATVVVVLCKIYLASNCQERVVSDQVTMQQCAIMSQIGVADWMTAQGYSARGWRVEKIKCVIGAYTERGA